MLFNKKLFPLILAGILWTACNTEQANETALEIKIDHTWGSSNEKIILNTPYTHPLTGETISFSKLRYYVSQIALKNLNGEWWNESESYHLATLSSNATTVLSLKDIPEGDYSELSFIVGVDSTRNVSGAQSGALSPTEQMFWNWNTGYIFIRMEGESPQATGTTFSYHIGGYSGANLAIQKCSFHFGNQVLRIRNQAKPQLHLYQNLQNNWNAENTVASHAVIHMPGPLAASMALRFASGFTFDHLHN
jgi:hypothetical protein